MVIHADTKRMMLIAAAVSLLAGFAAGCGKSDDAGAKDPNYYSGKDFQGHRSGSGESSKLNSDGK